jgi:hypothetical protein
VPRPSGGVIASNGDIHFIPYNATVGQMIVAATGLASTYSLAYTTTAAYHGGTLAPNGDIHFIPYKSGVGQKISAAGTPSTYTLISTSTSGAYAGGVLALSGEIYFVPYTLSCCKITTFSAVPFNRGMCLSSWLNKH